MKRKQNLSRPLANENRRNRFRCCLTTHLRHLHEKSSHPHAADRIGDLLSAATCSYLASLNTSRLGTYVCPFLMWGFIVWSKSRPAQPSLDSFRYNGSAFDLAVLWQLATPAFPPHGPNRASRVRRRDLPVAEVLRKFSAISTQRNTVTVWKQEQ